MEGLQEGESIWQDLIRIQFYVAEVLFESGNHLDHVRNVSAKQMYEVRGVHTPEGWPQYYLEGRKVKKRARGKKICYPTPMKNILAKNHTESALEEANFYDYLRQQRITFNRTNFPRHRRTELEKLKDTDLKTPATSEEAKKKEFQMMVRLTLDVFSRTECS